MPSMPSAQSSYVYSLSQLEGEAMEKYISYSLAAGSIRPSSSPVGAGFLFIQKKDKSLRRCVEYRGLNKIIVKNTFTLPLLSSALSYSREPLSSSRLIW